MRNVQVSSHFDLMLLDYQWTLILIFCVDVHMGLDPLPPVHMRPPEPDTLPLRVDVINGWTHSSHHIHLQCKDLGQILNS